MPILDLFVELNVDLRFLAIMEAGLGGGGEFPPFSLIRDFESKTPAGTFPKFPSVLRVIDRSDRNPSITAR